MDEAGVKTIRLMDILKVRGIEAILLSLGLVWAVWMIKNFVLAGSSLCVTFSR